MRAKAKYAVIYRHREQYPVSVMCRFFSVSRSGYYGFVKRMNRPEKDAALAETIRQQQDKCFHTYGYRRMWLVLEKQGIHRNPKTILRIIGDKKPEEEAVPAQPTLEDLYLYYFQEEER